MIVPLRARVAASIAVIVMLSAATGAGTTGTAFAGGRARGVEWRSVSATLRGLVGGRATTRATASTAVTSSSICWERDYTDAAGDAPIDALAYRLTYDCPSATWNLSVRLAAPVDPRTFDSLATEIDTDNDPNDGCLGFDVLVAGVFGAGGAPRGALVSTPTCDISTWSNVTTVPFSANGTALSLSYPESALGGAARLIWNAGVVPKAADAAVDELPDVGVLVADQFLQQTSAHDGYWLVDAAGGVHAYGNAKFLGDLAGVHLAAPVVGMTRRRDRGGYWLLGHDGGVFTFGTASFFGSTGGLRLNRPAVAMTASPAGRGYWFVASDGGIFAFGDARFHGSAAGLRLNRPIVGMAATPSGHGYWLVASDGGIFSYGDAAFHGSTGAMRLNRPIVGMVPTPSGNGYWLVASDGGIFSYGDAAFHGSTGALHLASPIVGMMPSRTGLGYRFVAADGGIFSYGDAAFLGGLGGGTPPSPIVGIG